MSSEPRAVTGLAAVVPANGWHGVYRDPGGRDWRCPLIGWGVTNAGSLVPLDSTPEGRVVDARRWPNFVRLEG